ncbi:ABC transporter ATP-binding protein [Desulfobacterota bacterium M19]
MITVKNLVKYYDDIPALKHINLNITGGITGLLGPNGAGKTTLMSILNGLTGFQAGSVEIFGLPLHQNLKKIRRRCSFVPQSLALYDSLSVIENLRFFAGIQQIKGRALHENIAYAVSVNQLQTQLSQKVSTLSGGQKRRLNIAIGLLNNPDILYLDEPTVGIDPESRHDILKMLRTFKARRKTVVYTSHYMAEIEEICDKVAIMDQGRIIKQGRLETIMAENSNDSVRIELTSREEKLHEFAEDHPDTQFINPAAIIIKSRKASRVGEILSTLEAEGMGVKQINYENGNLESLFIRLTSHAGEVQDV